MGWSFTSHPAARGEVTREFLDNWKSDTTPYYIKEHAWYGRSQLWGVLRRKDTDAPVCIVEWMVSFRRDSWGYKDLSEEMGPVDVGCPLRFLELVPLASGEDPHGWRAAWRERVRTEHAKLRRQWRVGDGVRLVGRRIGSQSAPVVTITALKPAMLVEY